VRKALLVLCSLLTVSCALLTRATERQLAGEWRYADAKQSCQYLFSPDGTFRGTVALGGRKVSQFAGKWRVEGKRLMYVYTSDALGRIPPGSTDQDELVVVAADRFEIEAADGSHRTYRRVP
jgi:hypothetical protein